MKEVVRATDPRILALLDRQATQYSGKDQLGLERITSLLDRLGRPQDCLPPVFHVAGTNGKGSTCAFLRFALEAAGRRVHMFTSPHLVRYNERIRLAGKLIDDDCLADIMGRVLDANEDIRASLFEINTAAAFIAFSEVPADACVIEVGLGGRLDATNVIEHPLVCGIASLGIDHEAFLLAEEAGVPAEPASRIGFEKAGIAKRGVPLVTLRYPAQVQATIAEAAAKAGAPLFVEGRDWQIDPTLRSSLLGEHQIRNANLAWQMLQRQDRIPVGRASFLSGLTSAQWPARFQEMVPGPLTGSAATWLDGAHNVAAAKALAALLADHGPKHIILGILANKDADAIIDALVPHALSLTFVPVPDHEHHDPALLAQQFGGRPASTLPEALADLPAPRLIAGSLYLAGEALKLNNQLPD